MSRERARVVMLSIERRVEELRQAGLAKVRANELEEALALYDEALSLTGDEGARELITINKADTLIALERSGPEIQELARVIMRRRSPRHVFLAAYALQYKNRLEGDFKRALFYGQLALRAAEESDDLFYKRAVLVDLGNVYEMDSQIGKAIDSFESALAVLDSADPAHRLSRGYALENLGYCHLLQGETERGVSLIHEALDLLDDPMGRAEAYIDLCYAHIDEDDLERAKICGEQGLAIAKDDRQIRNAHYLLGEVAYKTGDSEAADRHFDELSRFYPKFRNLKNLLFALDLRRMVNLKL
jgi:tetratricopeptide (TPR) repeat protein